MPATREDTQDRAMGDHAVAAVVRPRGGDDDQLPLGLAQAVGAVHQRVVLVEERAELGGPVAERPEDVGDEAGLLGDHADALLQVLGQLVQFGHAESADVHARAAGSPGVHP